MLHLECICSISAPEHDDIAGTTRRDAMYSQQAVKHLWPHGVHITDAVLWARYPAGRAYFVHST